jgi:hypothetical protein
VAQKLSRVPATDGEETSHGDGALSLRQVRLEGLGAVIKYFRACQHSSRRNQHVSRRNEFRRWLLQRRDSSLDSARLARGFRYLLKLVLQHPPDCHFAATKAYVMRR